jgi:RNA 2',3'-cyclic 3'-phosphodiesterase
MVRLFVALNLPKKERDRIHKASRALRDQELPVRWVAADKYHLTLKFLGEVRQDRVPMIQHILTRVAAGSPPFVADINGFGAFPTVRRPSVLWLGIEPSPALRCLKQDVEWALADAGFERETRAFHPHLTLGRVESENGAGAFRGLDEMLAELPYEGSVQVKSFELMRSQISREGGPQYSVLSSYPLAES